MTIFMTGFPGFLGSALLPGILRRTEADAICLIQPRYHGEASRRVAELVAADAAPADRIRLVEGDITEPGLGLADGALDGVTEAWHLAAVYDLAVERDLAMRVNVDGTRNVLDALGRCADLRRLHYFSTCYVSGRYVGAFAEDDLEVGAPFNNHYEETKHLAEVDVRARMAAGMPATIYRPSIVVGDSRTGETQKFDGPYFIIQWLLRQPRYAVLPVVGDPSLTCVNVVPSDFIVRAVTHLSGLDASIGRTYQLADPHPLTVKEFAETVARVIGREVVQIPLPKSVAKGAIVHVPGVHRLMRFPAEAVDYFAHPTYYLTDHARADLAGTGIAVPPFPTYAERLVAFMREHPGVSAAAMV